MAIITPTPRGIRLREPRTGSYLENRSRFSRPRHWLPTVFADLHMPWSVRGASIHSGLLMVTLSVAAVGSEGASSVRHPVLDLPAAVSGRCLQGVLLGIHKAGKRLVAV